MSSPSNSATLKDLLHEVTDAVEPGDRLDAIRSATADSGRRTRPGWWAAGGIGLVAASVVTALVLSTGGAPREAGPDPAAPPPTTPTTATEDPVPPTTYGPVEVFFVGDTQRGPRLYRELRSIASNDTESRLAWAIGVALGRAQDGSPRPPLDPDYRVPWPADTFGTAAFDTATGEIGITVGNTNGDSAPLRERGDLSPEEASVAVEALIRTAQRAVGRDAPVRFYLDGTITDQLLGVPTAEPLAAGPDVDVLSHVSLSEPSEGHTIRQGKALTIDGLGASEDGRVSIQVDGREGAARFFDMKLDLDPADSTLSPFSVSFFLGDLQPGDYDVFATVTNADGTLDSDTRRITVVD